MRTNITVNEVPEGKDVCIRFADRSLALATAIAFLAVVFWVVPHRAGRWVQLLVVGVAAAFIAWKFLFKQVIKLRPSHICIQKMFGPMTVGAPLELPRESILGWEVRERELRAKARRYVMRRMIFLSVSDEVELPIQLSPQDGRLLLELFQQSFASLATKGRGN